MRFRLKRRLKLKVMRVRPGDTVIFSTPEPLSNDEAESIRAELAKDWPECRILVISQGELSVTRNA